MKKRIRDILLLIAISSIVVLESCASPPQATSSPTLTTAQSPTPVIIPTSPPPTATVTRQEAEVYNPAGVRADGVFVDMLLKKTMMEQGITSPPMAAEFPETAVETVAIQADMLTEINELFLKRGWGDGLPIVPPTQERVQEMLAGTDLPPEWVVGELQPMGGQATVEKIAVNAVMAGCRAEHMPILIAAVEAIMSPDFDQLGVATTTNPDTYMLIVSGPIVEEINLNPGTNALGRGVHDNAAIGRAFHLLIQNVGGSWPGVSDMSDLGHPGDFGMCLPENGARNPWSPIHMDLGHPKNANVVTVLSVSSMQNIVSIGMDNEQFMQRVAGLLTFGGRQPQSLVLLIVPPDVADEFANAGWTKDSMKQAVVDYGEISTSFKEQLLIVVSGGPGEKNYLISNWMNNKKPVSREIRLPANWNDLLEKRGE